MKKIEETSLWQQGCNEGKELKIRHIFIREDYGYNNGYDFGMRLTLQERYKTKLKRVTDSSTDPLDKSTDL